MFGKKEKDNIHKNIYYNKNITQSIVDDVIYSINSLKLTSIDKIKKYINNLHKTTLNFKTITYILKINNLECENFKIKKDIEIFIIDSILKNKVITIKEIIKNIINKFNIKLSENSIYNTLKKIIFLINKLK